MKFEDIIKQTVERVITDWGMMLVEPCESSVQCFDSSRPMIVTDVHYHGPFEGKFRVALQEPFMRTLTCNILGTDAPPSETEQLDAARELSNVLSGNLITEMYGVDTVFALDSPRIKVTYVTELDELLGRRPFFWKGDGSPFAFSFEIHDSEDEA